jgi:hypothetical protein
LFVVSSSCRCVVLSLCHHLNLCFAGSKVLMCFPLSVDRPNPEGSESTSRPVEAEVISTPMSPIPLATRYRCFRCWLDLHLRSDGAGAGCGIKSRPSSASTSARLQYCTNGSLARRDSLLYGSHDGLSSLSSMPRHSTWNS